VVDVVQDRRRRVRVDDRDGLTGAVVPGDAVCALDLGRRISLHRPRHIPGQGGETARERVRRDQLRPV